MAVFLNPWVIKIWMVKKGDEHLYVLFMSRGLTFL